jgi:thiosulfate/3-mercaptopyruvate sulfurtransferase
MPRTKTLHLIVLLAALNVAAHGAGSSAAAGRYANPQLLAETEEVARALVDPSARVVDVRGGMIGRAAYRAGHVPGAVYLDASELDDPAANAEGLPIRPEAAASLFFVLEYSGHERVRVMNGGLAKWRREGRPLELAAPAITPRRFEPRARRELVATAPEVHASLRRPEACLIDARTPAEFAGAGRGAREGHIPGAANVEWTSTLNADGTFKDADALRALFAAAGLAPDRTAIVYCTSGTRASHAYLALRLLGHARIRNYDGSWKEWATTPALPVTK